MHVGAVIIEAKRGHQIPEPELQAVVNDPSVWVLGVRLWSYGRVLGTLNCRVMVSIHELITNSSLHTHNYIRFPDSSQTPPLPSNPVTH